MQEKLRGEYKQMTFLLDYFCKFIFLKNKIYPCDVVWAQLLFFLISAENDNTGTFGRP